MNFEGFNHSLLHEFGIESGDVIIVGVSGGSDSTCLLDLLQKSGTNIIIAHFNHGLRIEANEDSEYIKNLSERRGIKCIQGSEDVRSFAKNAKLSIEDAARKLRYKFLFEVANQYHAHAVAVGHTADDQVETILMHLLRGCGLDGLQGMVPRSITEFNAKTPLIRPLLEFTRNEILAYCQANNLTYLEDRSNQEKIFLRNRIRLELIPSLESYNPRVKENILKMARIIQGDVEVLTERTREILQEYLLAESDCLLKISLTKIKESPIGMQRRIIVNSLKKLNSNNKEIDFQKVEQVIRFVGFPPRTRHLHLFSDIEVRIENGTLFFYRSYANIPTDEWPQMKGEKTLKVNIPGSKIIHPDWQISCNETSIFPKQNNLDEGLNFNAFIDLEKVQSPLMIRTQKRGDRYELLGLEGKSQKLSDFWINKKIPNRLRSRWPLVISNEKIVWIPGFAPAHFCRVQTGTKKILHVELSRNF